MRSRFHAIGGCLALSLLLGVVAARPLAAQSAQASPSGSTTLALPAETSGAAIYKAACQTCHGADGKGSPEALVGFTLPLPDGHDLPDFTECATNTAESVNDWQTVATRGGPIRGLDRHMPAFGEALAPEQLASVVGYLRQFCADHAWPDGTLNMPRAFFTEKAFPENEFVWSTAWATRSRHSATHLLNYEHRLGARGMYEVVVPVDFQPGPGGTSRARGIGDVELAGRRVLASSSRHGSIVAAGGAVTLPTGRTSLGLGSGYAVYEPFGMWDQLIGPAGFLQVHGGYEIPSDRTAGTREAYLRTAAGFTIAQDGGHGRAWTPMMELLLAKPAGAAAEWDVAPELQISLSKLQHVLLSTGLRIPVTARQERHPQVLTYVIWDWFDGGFLKFWH